MTSTLFKDERHKERARTTLDHAVKVFIHERSAVNWMLQPAFGLDWRRPIDVIETDEGAETVRHLLGRIDYCIPS